LYEQVRGYYTLQENGALGKISGTQSSKVDGWGKPAKGILTARIQGFLIKFFH
jgi:hypothetical protein